MLIKLRQSSSLSPLSDFQILTIHYLQPTVSVPVQTISATTCQHIFKYTLHRSLQHLHQNYFSSVFLDVLHKQGISSKYTCTSISFNVLHQKIQESSIQKIPICLYILHIHPVTWSHYVPHFAKVTRSPIAPLTSLPN